MHAYYYSSIFHNSQTISPFHRITITIRWFIVRKGPLSNLVVTFMIGLVCSCAPFYQGKNVRISYQGYQTIDDNYYLESFSHADDIRIIDNQIFFGQDTVIYVREMGCFFKKCSWQDDHFVYSLTWSFWKRKFFIFNKRLRNLEMKFFLTRIEPVDP